MWVLELLLYLSEEAWSDSNETYCSSDASVVSDQH